MYVHIYIYNIFARLQAAVAARCPGSASLITSERVCRKPEHVSAAVPPVRCHDAAFCRGRNTKRSGRSMMAKRSELKGKSINGSTIHRGSDLAPIPSGSL